MAKTLSTESKNVQSTPEGKGAIVGWIKSQRVKPLLGQTVGQLLIWFSDQPEDLTNLIMRYRPGQPPDEYAAALHQIADEIERSGTDRPTFPDMIPADQLQKSAASQSEAASKARTRKGK